MTRLSLLAVIVAASGATAADAQKDAPAPRQIRVQIAPAQIQAQPVQIQVQINGQRIQIAPAQPAIAPIARPAIGRYMYYGQDSLSLLMNPMVVKELKLDGDIRTEAREAMQEVQRIRSGDYRKLRQLKPQERIKKQQELQSKFIEDSDAKAKEILEPKQYKRLQEILVQVQGLNALQNPIIQKKLKITDAQKKKFVEARKASSVKRQKAFKELRGNVGPNGRPVRGLPFNPKKYQELNTKLQKELEKDTLAVLTKKQSEQFAKMKGKKFDMGNRGRFGGGGIFLPQPLRPLPFRRNIQIQIQGNVIPVKPIQIQIEELVPVKPVQKDK